MVWPPPEYSRDSDKNRLDSDGELVVKSHDYSTGPLGQNVNRSPYTSFIDSDEDSGDEHSRFVVASDDDSDEEHHTPSQLSNTGYKRIVTQRASAGRASRSSSPYDSDDAPLGTLFQRTPTLPEYQKLDPQSE
ncbi:hypothetical protein DSO57_1019900 [Entomophthora muscae]|uniref:Uncharacterized protein n=1 Tax=Entomophthora muscae TaxID=34485 RepID=A0ACC2TEP2_9FUNG|nr:hypothetical protein DSO57_1019900 [Entomophthora muscae]